MSKSALRTDDGESPVQQHASMARSQATLVLKMVTCRRHIPAANIIGEVPVFLLHNKKMLLYLVFRKTDGGLNFPSSSSTTNSAKRNSPTEISKTVTRPVEQAHPRPAPHPARIHRKSESSCHRNSVRRFALRFGPNRPLPSIMFHHWLVYFQKKTE